MGSGIVPRIRETPMMNRLRWSSALITVLVAAAAYMALNSFPLKNGIFPLDDAYIHWVYADNLAAARGFSFNADEPSMGTSSPLFVFLGALVVFLGLDYYFYYLVSSAVFFLGSAILVYRILLRLLAVRWPQTAEGWRQAFAGLGALLFATNGNVVWYAMSGMETMLCLFLALLGLHLYLRRGWDWLTGIVFGLLLWSRITGLSLLAVLFAADLVRRRPEWRGYLVTALVYAPCVLLSLENAGSLLPTNVAAKKMTYVDGQWSLDRFLSYLVSVVRYLAYLPAFRVLLAAAATWAVAAPVVYLYRRYVRGVRAAPALGIWIILGWGALHVAMYGLTFRTLLHHLRYLADLFPVLAIAGTYAVFGAFAARGRAASALGVAVLLALAAVSASNVRYWSALYLRNIEHMEDVYVPAARWIRDFTPADARVAAFDIGLLKHVSGRYVIDLGGLVDPAVHPFLKKRRCGDYLWKEGASCILYSCEPDCDIFTGVYLAEYEGDHRLRASRVAAFGTPHYPAPTITHSSRLEIDRIDEWLTTEPEDQERLFTEGAGPFAAAKRIEVDPHVELVACRVEPDPLNYCGEMMQRLDLTYFWSAPRKLKRSFWVRTEIIGPDGEVIFRKSHIPTHNAYPPADWKPGQIVRDHHVIWSSGRWVPGRYDIAVAMDREKNGPAFGGSAPVVVGSLAIKDSPLRPVKMKWKKLE